MTLHADEILADYRLACESRSASALARKEVYSGKAKFGVFGTGKEVAQIAMAKYFLPGDFRSGYYRDQTFMMATGELTLKQYFAQLYAHADVNADPHSGGRMMIGHYATRSLNPDGSFKDLTKIKNSSPDISPTGAQMPRMVGLAFASKLYRENPELHKYRQFSNNGNEISWGTIGNGACAEGIFFEAINAAGVLQIPMLVSIWDDAYAISVTQELQTTKLDISAMFTGFQRSANQRGIEILRSKGWDYKELCTNYYLAANLCRKEHVPVLHHVYELTQPFGHSTSGSHERYKPKERLLWEEEYDCNKQFRKWILSERIATEAELDKIEREALQAAKDAREQAWKEFNDSMLLDYREAIHLISMAAEESMHSEKISDLKKSLEKTINPLRCDVIHTVKKVLRTTRHEQLNCTEGLKKWVKRTAEENKQRFNSNVYSSSQESPLLIEEIKPRYNEDSPYVDGREVLQHNFEALLRSDPRIFALGEDVGQIGDVNQGFAGLQEKFGKLRVMDTGIREATIIGQGIGAAMRGLKPIAEIQYLDYIYFCIQTLADDLATLHYRTAGGQKAPLIIRTRGHRLEGMFHSGSPISMILGSIRGMYLAVPRNMTQAAGMYNTLLRGDNPALIIETLNAYRLKERLPVNLGEFTVPLGIPEILQEGTDITIVTYGAMCRIVMEASKELAEYGISCEVIDVQTLLPFDRMNIIAKSIQKTNRVLFTDEDVPGGATAYMMQQVLEIQNAYRYLDSPPRTLTAKEHRPSYGTDGDYFSKPNRDDVVDAVYDMMHESNPSKFPPLT
ncbi:MAG: thiamine pyrophosphate-dependent enzyme [Cytophagaceae bacterium]|nr:thiamine pyrophosphate-dependent enzyme [Cytophagaceae bacterium]MDW8457099.1 thiamine pyrophosphate-dependent enzyme [Cytophagaceae bacterium]